MAQLIIGLCIFLGVHSLSIINEPWRNKMAERLGTWTWKGIYSLVSLIGLFMMIRGYGSARVEAVELYFPPAWLQYISIFLLIPCFPLLVGAYFPGRIKAAVGHPMLLATILWAAVHLFVNGTTADLVLFGSMLGWSIVDLFSVIRREPREIPGAPESKYNDWIAVVIGLALYFAFLLQLHELLFGLSVLEWS